MKEGNAANFVVFDCADEAEAIRLRPAARWVVRNGRVVAETEPARSVVHVDGQAQPVTFTPERTPAPAASPSGSASPIGRDAGASRKEQEPHMAPISASGGHAHPRGRPLDRSPRHGADPGVAPAMARSARLFTVWFTPNLVPAAFFIGTLVTLDFLKLGFVTVACSRSSSATSSGSVLVGVLSTMGPKHGHGPDARPPGCRSASRSSCPGLLNWLSTIGWDGDQQRLRRVRHRRS